MLFLFSLLMIVCLSAPCACAQQPQLMTRQTSDAFMTVSMLSLYDTQGDEQAFAQTWAAVKQTLHDVEQAVSVSIPSSDIARFNALDSGEEIEISSITHDIVQIAFDVHAMTDGLYDPTVYPLVDLWGFSPRFNQNTYSPAMPYDRAYVDGSLPLPDARHIQALLPLVGLEHIELREENGTYYLKKNTPSVIVDGVTLQAQLDLGGIAKGYACDLVRALLEDSGYEMGTFVSGGSSMVLLGHPSGDYTLTLRKPRKGENQESHFALLNASHTALSTSSDTSHSFVRDGVIYCHILDPRTGYPINMPEAQEPQFGVATATLLCDSAAYGDALTTALCIMGAERAAAFLQEHDVGQAVLTQYQSNLDTFAVVSNANRDSLTLTDPAYHLITAQENYE